MGYMVHHSIIVSDYDEKRLRQTWLKAKDIFSNTKHHLSNITPMAVNSERSYFIAPDGSKRGWNDSQSGYEARKEFIEYLKSLKFSPSWVLVQFDDDEHQTLVLDSSDHFISGKKPEAHWD